MKKDEIKRDRVAETIVHIVATLKNNLILVAIVIFALAVGVGLVSNNFEKNEAKETKSLKEADSIMIKLISSNSVIDTNIQNDINSLYKKYPDSEAVNYLGLLLIKLDSSSKEQRINLIKNSITNEWFKTQAFLISGDYYSDNLDYKSAELDYNNAIKYASSNAQKGYCYYKLGNVYFEMNDLSKALDSYKKADDLFVVSKKSESLNRDSQFQGWVSNNKIALHHTENLLKK